MQTNRLNQKQILITGVDSARSQSNLFDLMINSLFKQFLHLLQYRELIRNLVIRDLKVRYKKLGFGRPVVFNEPVIDDAGFYRRFHGDGPGQVGLSRKFSCFCFVWPATLELFCFFGHWLNRQYCG